MQISKISLCFCALALCTGFTALAEDTPAQAAARAAMEEKLQQLQGGSVAAPQTPATPAPAESAPAATAPAVTTPAPTQAPVTTDSATAPQMAAQPGDNEAQAAARAAVEAKMSQLGTPVTSAPAPVIVSAEKMPSPKTAAMMGKPIVAPPLPISMTKEQKLSAILAQYEANQISPEQYHEQRAAILADKQ